MGAMVLFHDNIKITLAAFGIHLPYVVIMQLTDAPYHISKDMTNTGLVK